MSIRHLKKSIPAETVIKLTHVPLLYAEKILAHWGPLVAMRLATIARTPSSTHSVANVFLLAISLLLFSIVVSNDAWKSERKLSKEYWNF